MHFQIWKVHRICATLLLAAVASAAHAEAPSQQSIDRLLEVMQVNRTLESMRGQIESVTRSSMLSALKDRQVTDKDRAILDRFREKLATIMAEELSPAQHLATIRQVYSEAYTQDEVDRLIALYASETGQLLVNKVPLVTQKAMQLVQDRMPAMVERVRRAMLEVQAEIKAEKDMPR